MNPKLKKIVAITVIILGVFSWIYFVVNVYELKNNQHLAWQNYISIYHPKPVLVADISSWMTFDYINKIFKLPETLLKDTLQINDKRYPLLTIRQYTRETNTNTGLLVQNIQKAVETYLASSKTKQ